MLMGLLLGLSCHFLSESDRFREGAWCGRRVPCLRFGVALLGLRLSHWVRSPCSGWPAVMAVCAAVCYDAGFWRLAAHVCWAVAEISVC